MTPALDSKRRVFAVRHLFATSTSPANFCSSLKFLISTPCYWFLADCVKLLHIWDGGFNLREAAPLPLIFNSKPYLDKFR